MFGAFIDSNYLVALEINDTTGTARYTSYLDLHIEIDSAGRLRSQIYDERDDFKFPIGNLSSICSTLKQHLHMKYIYTYIYIYIYIYIIKVSHIEVNKQYL
jgi:hypothetical protein